MDWIDAKEQLPELDEIVVVYMPFYSTNSVFIAERHSYDKLNSFWKESHKLNRNIPLGFVTHWMHVAKIDDEPKVNIDMKWISVNNKLPEVNEMVIVLIQRQSIIKNAFMARRSVYGNFNPVWKESHDLMTHIPMGYVTHWMPIPEINDELD